MKKIQQKNNENLEISNFITFHNVKTNCFQSNNKIVSQILLPNSSPTESHLVSIDFCVLNLQGYVPFHFSEEMFI